MACNSPELHAILIVSCSVFNSSKDGPFNQTLAYLWSFLNITAHVSIIFCNFAVKQQKSIMAKLNGIRVVLAERVGIGKAFDNLSIG